MQVSFEKMIKSAKHDFRLRFRRDGKTVHDMKGFSSLFIVVTQNMEVLVFPHLKPFLSCVLSEKDPH